MHRRDAAVLPVPVTRGGAAFAGALCACWSSVPHRDPPPAEPNALTAFATALVCGADCTTTQLRWTLHVADQTATLEVAAGDAVRVYRGARDAANAGMPSQLDEITGGGHLRLRCRASTVDAHPRDADLLYRCDGSSHAGRWTQDLAAVRAVECAADGSDARIVFAHPALEWLALRCAGDGSAAASGFRVVGDGDPVSHRNSLVAPDSM